MKRKVASVNRMTGQFALTIDLGNEDMRSVSDVAWALRQLANKLDDTETYDRADSGRILDFNGNKVGEWSLEEDEP